MEVGLKQDIKIGEVRGHGEEGALYPGVWLKSLTCWFIKPERGKKFLATLKIELKSHPNSLIGYSQDTKAGPSREKSMPTPPSILPVLWASLINLMLKVILKFLPNKLQLCFFLACSGILFWCKAKNPHSSRDLFRELLQQAIWRESCLQPVPHYCWQVEGAEFGAQRMIEKKEEKDKRRQQERLKLE